MGKKKKQKANVKDIAQLLIGIGAVLTGIASIVNEITKAFK